MKRILYLVAVWLVASSFTTIHLMGDSTMAEKDLSDGKLERGWGMMFPNFVDDTFRVVNYAQNGRSTKSFIDKGLWDMVQYALQPGDYVFIQFGHNDAKADDPDRYAPAFGAYQENLRTFIRGAREKGATPILLTPVARRWFKNGKLDRNCHTDYPAAMKQVAEEMGVTVLDITTPTLDWIESIGDEASKAYFMISTGKDDNTHTVASGARKVTEIVCEALKAQVPAIGEHLVRYDIVVDRHDKITTILIKAGTYKEAIDIPHTKFRMKIMGQGADKTILTYDRYAEQLWPDNDFKVGTSGSASIYIHSSYVTFEDITFENTAGEGKEIGQAVAVFTHVRPFRQGRRHQAELFPGLLHRGHDGLHLRPQHRLFRELPHPLEEEQLRDGGFHPPGPEVRLRLQELQADGRSRHRQVLPGPPLGRLREDRVHRLRARSSHRRGRLARLGKGRQAQHQEEFLLR